MDIAKPSYDDMTIIRDFTRPDRDNRPKKFKLNGYTFECAARLPVGGAKLLAAINKADPSDAMHYLGEFLGLVLFPGSAAKFEEVLSDPTDPVDQEQLLDILKWMINEYQSGDANRPTMQSHTSATGHTETGMTLMDGVQLTG